MGGGLTQREIATRSGIAPSTYGNLESYPHRVVSRSKVERILVELGAPAAKVAEVLQAYEAAPASAYAEKMREVWAKRREHRGKIRRSGALERALVRLLELRFAEGDKCDCVTEADGIHESGTFLCELCDSVRALGLGESWSLEIGDALSARAAELGVDNEPPADNSQHVNNPEDNALEFG
jgi:transcriptional regulator with XRE-family HTH domain